MNIQLNVSFLKHTLALGFGVALVPDEDEPKEAEHAELHTQTERATLGFRPNDEWEEDEDDE